MAIETPTLLRFPGFGMWALSGLPLAVTLAHDPALLGVTSYARGPLKALEAGDL